MSFVDAFSAQFEIWQVAQPFVSLMFNDQEMALVLALAESPLTVEQLASKLHLSRARTQDLLKSCYHRQIVDLESEGAEACYRATNFYVFLDYFVKYGNWDDIPATDRIRIDRKYLDEFKSRVAENVQLKMAGKSAPNALPNDSVLLLHEVEVMIDAATDICVQPCNCRRLRQACDMPVETCIWLDAGAREALRRGHGRPLTKDEAKDLLRTADQKGLMHTADSDWQHNGLHAICNCCACDCYPFRAADEFHSKGVWPKVRYVAEYDPTLCSMCGSCVRRCHFDAFTFDGTMTEVSIKGKTKRLKTVCFDPEYCWGCGLCANACNSSAISIQPC